MHKTIGCGSGLQQAIRLILPAALSVCCLISFAAYGCLAEEPCFQPGVRNSRTRPLAGDQLRALADEIRSWTGFAGVQFDHQGRLQIGSPSRFSGGSEAARRLILAAVESVDGFELERHDRSANVAFAAIQPVEDYVDGLNRKHTLWTLKLDFYDFRQLRGGPDGIDAFDPAICLFHELAHGVLHLSDELLSSDPLGTCEHYINQIRRETGRAERQSYRPRFRVRETIEYPGLWKYAELVFVKRRTGDKTKTAVLSFRVESVCAPGMLHD